MSTHPVFVSRRYATANEFVDSCAPPLIKTRATQANHALAAPCARVRALIPAPPPDTSEEWLISITPESSGENGHRSDVMFTLTVMDIQPGVLACSIDPKDLSKVYIEAAMEAMVHAAVESNLSPSRLSSVLAPTSLGYPFADIWAARQALSQQESPILRLAQSYIMRDTVRPGAQPHIEDVDIDLVDEGEIDAATALIVEFTGTLPSSLNLGWEAAFKLASAATKDRELARAVINGQVVAFVMLARRTPGVKAIANVYTKPEARGKGLAEALVRFTVNAAFKDSEIDKICLYVYPENFAAARLYGRVGFVGLETGVPDERTEEWAELGFEGGLKP